MAGRSISPTRWKSPLTLLKSEYSMSSCLLDFIAVQLQLGAARSGPIASCIGLAIGFMLCSPSLKRRISVQCATETEATQNRSTVSVLLCASRARLAETKRVENHSVGERTLNQAGEGMSACERPIRAEMGNLANYRQGMTVYLRCWRWKLRRSKTAHSVSARGLKRGPETARHNADAVLFDRMFDVLPLKQVILGRLCCE